MSYFQNEIWPTGPGTDIRVAGNLVSTANPFVISQGNPPTAAITIGDNDLTISRNVDIIGNFTINGSPIDISVDVADLEPGIFGANEAPGTFSFQNGLNIDGNLTVVNPINDSEFGISIAGSTNLYLQRADVGLNIQIGGSPGLTELYAYNGISRGDINVIANVVNFDANIFQLNGERVPSLTFFQSSTGSSTEIDWFEGSVQEWTINANVTFTFANPIAGRTYVLIITQGTGGSRVPTLTGWDFGDNPPVWSTTVGAKDVVTGVYDGTQYLAAQAVANA